MWSARRRDRRLVPACAAAALAVLLAAPAAPIAAQERTILQRILVKVNGEAFTQTDLVQRQVEVLKADKQVSATPRDIQTDKALTAVLIEITPGILLDVVDELLLVQRGRELGYTLTDADFQRSLENLKKQFNLDDAGLRAGLAQEGLTMETYRAVAERQSIIAQLQRNDMMQRPPTDEESRQYYNAHKDEFLTPATVSVREISIAVPTVMQDGRQTFNAAADEEAKTKITAARDRALKGEDYTKLVAEISESPTKTSGGLIPQIKLGEIDPTLRAALEKVPQSGISEPVRMASGYSIFKIEEKVEAQPKPFDAVRGEIVDKIFAQRAEAETLKYVNKLREQALIEWKDEDLKKAYDKALAARTAAPGK